MVELKFIRYSVCGSDIVPLYSPKEWYNIYDFCIRHSLLGVGLCGMERLSDAKRLPEDNAIPKDLLFDWIAMNQQVEQRNKLLSQRCLELQKMIAEAGFSTLILKGQGNALMYPNPLRRQSGDIDIWVLPKDGRCKKEDVRRIVELLGTKCDIGKQVIGYHHVEFPIFDDVEVEVHWRPSWRSSPLYNHRLQKWCRKMAEGGCCVKADLPNRSGEITIPTWDFNVVYLLQHMFLHIFQEGLGLRQVLDYYYLLRSEGRSKMADVSDTLRYLGLYEFAGAVMYVMKEVFLLDDQYMIAPVDGRRGKHLLNEILQSGNFGQYDYRNRELHQKQGIRRSLSRLKRQYRFLRDYPHETLCAPFQVYHVIWRKLQLWRY